MPGTDMPGGIIGAGTRSASLNAGPISSRARQQTPALSSAMRGSATRRAPSLPGVQGVDVGVGRLVGGLVSGSQSPGVSTMVTAVAPAATIS
jgi:hypothetical protein